MVALTRFVIEAQQAPTIHHIGQPVLECMLAALETMRYPPDNHLGKSIPTEHEALSEELHCLRVVYYYNNVRRCQWLQHTDKWDSGALLKCVHGLMNSGFSEFFEVETD